MCRWVACVIDPLTAPTLEEIKDARGRLAGSVVRTPLNPLDWDDGPEIYLKLENLQPIGSFKLRGAGNAMARAGRDALLDGVLTASAGNMAQGVAWNARRFDIPCTVVVLLAIGIEHFTGIKQVFQVRRFLHVDLTRELRRGHNRDL